METSETKTNPSVENSNASTEKSATSISEEQTGKETLVFADGGLSERLANDTLLSSLRKKKYVVKLLKDEFGNMSLSDIISRINNDYTNRQTEIENEQKSRMVWDRVKIESL